MTTSQLTCDGVHKTLDDLFTCQECEQFFNLKKVQVNVKSVYGQDYIYPANNTALLLLDLTGKKTFSKKHISTIKALGYDVTVTTPQINI